MRRIFSVQFGRLLGALLSIVLLADGLLAANLSLFFNDPNSPDPVEIITGQLSAPVPIGVVNDSVPDAAEDFLTGWQLSLVILPEAGATGSVTFASPVGPRADAPPNYLLDGVNAGIAAVNSGDALLAFDFNFPPTGGVEAPVDPGSFLLLIELLASNDADGEFGIYAVPGPAGTEWTDAAPVIQQVRAFENVPHGAAPVWIGSVLVRIPEPATFALLMFGLTAAFFSRMRAKPHTAFGVKSS